MHPEHLISGWASGRHGSLQRHFLFTAVLLFSAARTVSAPSISMATPTFWPAPLQGEVQAVRVSGSNGFATLSTGWFVTFHTAEPAPVVSGQCRIAGPGGGLDVAGGYAYKEDERHAPDARSSRPVRPGIAPNRHHRLAIDARTSSFIGRGRVPCECGRTEDFCPPPCL